MYAEKFYNPFFDFNSLLRFSNSWDKTQLPKRLKSGAKNHCFIFSPLLCPQEKEKLERIPWLFTLTKIKYYHSSKNFYLCFARYRRKGTCSLKAYIFSLNSYWFNVAPLQAFFKSEFSPYKVEQPLQAMDVQEK